MPTLHKSDFTFKTEPLKHQLEALCQSATKTNFAYLMEMGCVDGETEFLSNRGWVKFKDFHLHKWEEPLLVGQCRPSKYSSCEERHIFSFRQPKSFIKKTAQKMYHFTGYKFQSRTPSLDIMVTEDHNMRGRLVQGMNVLKHVEDDVPAKDFAQHLSKRVESTKPYEGYRCEVLQKCWMSEGVIGYNNTSRLNKLSRWEMRLLVAIIADGNFPSKNSDKCVMEFSKERKIERFEMLCQRAGVIVVKESIRGGKSVRFQLIAPAHKKIFDKDFWLLDTELQDVIFDEVFYWDGSDEKARKRFYTIHKDSADYIQFLCFTHGFDAQLSTGVSNNAPYYTVSINPNKSIVDAETSPQAYSTITECEEIKDFNYVYCFRTETGQLVLRRNDKIFVTGNSGKTKVIIDNMAYLRKKKAIEAAIVLAPKGVYRNWSTQEIPKHMPEEANAQVLVWRADASAGYKSQLLKDIKDFDKKSFPILVFNIESLLSAKGIEVIKLFLKAHKGMVMGIIDESTCIKNPKAKRTKEALKIASQCRVRRIATGSPVTNSPLDLYSQFAFLDKQILGCGSFYAFRNVYAEIERITTRQGQSFDKILKYKNLPMLASRIKDFSYRITKKECLDLPDKVYITRDVELTSEQRKLYKEMKDLSFAVDGEDVMSVQVALTKLLRLHQILCGSFTTDEGETKQIPNNRLSALQDVLSETGGKVIIWANYLQNIRDIQELLTKEYGPESFVTYTGSVSSDDRVRAIQLFQNANSPVRFFLGNVQTAGRGITLTAANTVVYFSNNYSLEMRQQSEDRAHRVGQTKSVTYVDLIARDSLDEKIIQALLAKRNIANEILNDDLEDWIKL